MQGIKCCSPGDLADPKGQAHTQKPLLPQFSFPTQSSFSHCHTTVFPGDPTQRWGSAWNLLSNPHKDTCMSRKSCEPREKLYKFYRSRWAGYCRPKLQPLNPQHLISTDGCLQRSLCFLPRGAGRTWESTVNALEIHIL